MTEGLVTGLVSLGVLKKYIDMKTKAANNAFKTIVSSVDFIN